MAKSPEKIASFSAAERARFANGAISLSVSSSSCHVCQNFRDAPTVA